MKKNHIFLILSVFLALGIFCGVLLTLSSPTLYEAKYDAFSTYHIDPATKKVVTTNDAATIFPLMEELFSQFDMVADGFLEGDANYTERMISQFGNTLSLFSTNLNRLKLTNTDLNTIRQMASTLKLSSTILKDDTEQVKSIMKGLNITNPNLNETINAQYAQITSEMKNTIPTFQNSLSSLISLSQTYGINTDKYSNKFNNVTAYFKNYTNLEFNLTKTNNVIFTLSPSSGIYGDTITISGHTDPSIPITAYLDQNIWINRTSDTAGLFSVNAKILKIPSGIHTIRIGIPTSSALSNPENILVFPSNTSISIISDTQESTATGTMVTFEGNLQTATKVRVQNAPVSLINAQTGQVIAQGITNNNGIWNASALMDNGDYEVYALFSNPLFPLTENRSELIHISVGANKSVYFYFLIGIAGLGIGGYIVWRNLRTRKPVSETTEDTHTEIKSQEMPISIARRAADPNNIPDEFEDIKPDILPPVLPYPQGIESGTEIRDVYRCIIHALAKQFSIEHIDAHTPHEISEIVGDESVTTFLENYQYLRYAVDTVSPDELKTFKDMARQLTLFKMEDT